jgi:hypothetical protein
VLPQLPRTSCRRNNPRAAHRWLEWLAGELTRYGGWAPTNNLQVVTFSILWFSGPDDITTCCIANMQVRSGRTVSLASVSAAAFPWHTPSGYAWNILPSGPSGVESVEK